MQDFRDLPPKINNQDQVSIYPVPKEVVHIKPFIEEAISISNQTQKPITLVHHGKDTKSEIAIIVPPGSNVEKISKVYNEQAGKLGRENIPNGTVSGELKTKSQESHMAATRN